MPLEPTYKLLYFKTTLKQTKSNLRHFLDDLRHFYKINNC